MKLSKEQKEQVIAALKTLKGFIGPMQLNFMAEAVKGEEGQFFLDKMVELASVIEKMPKSYETDGMGDKAVAHLHYFVKNMDWYITEKDSDPDGDGQLQAFGWADLGHGGGELGYIPIAELIASNVELDFHFEPLTIGQIKKAA